MITNHYKTDFKVYRTSGSIDENNFKIETDVLYSSGKGFFEPLSGKERYKNDKKQVDVSYRLFSNVTDITEKDVIEINSIKYDIDSVMIYNTHHMEIYLMLEK